jgi:histidinol dehydrogenase
VYRKRVLGNTRGFKGQWRPLDPGSPDRKDDGLIMRILDWNALDDQGRDEALARPAMLSDADLIESVVTIMADVLTGGDAKLIQLTEKYDGVRVDELQVPKSELKIAWNGLDAADRQAMQVAKSNIEKFHAAQMPQTIEIETMPGVTCRREPRALESAGLYVPAGTAPLVSTMIMLAVPAKIAGVARRVVTTPPGNNGKIDQRILAAAYLCGIDEVYQVGGAQAIAALAYGTETIPKVAKIFGPGNAYVAAAKSLAAQEPGGPAIDLPAGPSEAMVLADDKSNPVFVAADLLSQAEHDTMAQVVCVCASHAYASALQAEIKQQLGDLPRADIARASLENGRIFIVDSREQMVEIANAYAPEHLVVQVESPDELTPSLINAGSIFLGPWTPESVGDYASGTNHTLPTNGAARAYSGVVLESFMKYISVQSLTRAGLEALGPTVERLADMEGLEAHRRAVSLRLGNGDPS